MCSQYLSKEGLEKIKEELEKRKNIIRPRIAKKVLEATGYGDLSENAEYIEAKEMQMFNEGKIDELEEILKDVILINRSGKYDSVVIGSTIEAESNGNKMKLTIVGPSESSPEKGFISNESPLGRAFLDKKKGDEVDVETPKGRVKYKILDVT